MLGPGQKLSEKERNCAWREYKKNISMNWKTGLIANDEYTSKLQLLQQTQRSWNRFCGILQIQLPSCFVMHRDKGCNGQWWNSDCSSYATNIDDGLITDVGIYKNVACSRCGVCKTMNVQVMGSCHAMRRSIGKSTEDLEFSSWNLDPCAIVLSSWWIADIAR